MKFSALLSLIAIGCLVGCGQQEGDGHKSDPTPAGKSNAEVQSQQDFMNYSNQQSKNAGTRNPQIKGN